MFEPYNAHLLEIIDKYTDPNRTSLNSHQIGHRNMLENATLNFYQSGHIGQAQKILNQLRKLYPSDKVKASLVDFARAYFLEELRSLTIYDAKEIVQMLLREMYFRYAMGDDDEAAGRERIAKEVYDFYNKSYSDDTRVPLPAFGRMKYLALLDFWFDEQYPQQLRDRLHARISIEKPELYKELRAEAEKMQQELQKTPQGPLR